MVCRQTRLPVSYTHLDVYKRQGIIEAGLTFFPVLIARMLYSLCFIISFITGNFLVLYGVNGSSFPWYDQQQVLEGVVRFIYAQSPLICGNQQSTDFHSKESFSLNPEHF